MNTWRRLKAQPSLWDTYFTRETVIHAVRDFFQSEAFHEVETPILLPHPPAESYLDVFETILLDRHRNPTKAYLATSPETSLKKLLVAGIGNCWSLTKSFRNMETYSGLHNPEFTILEWYRVGAEYTDIMDDCQRLVGSISHAMGNNGPTITYQGSRIDLTPPWERITVAEAFERWAGIRFDDFLDEEKARSIAKNKGYRVTDANTWEELYNQIYLNEIEPHLGEGKPTIICEFPASVAALSQLKPEDPRFAQRFELYIAGLELADCYRELTDWEEQKRRFDTELEHIRRKGNTVYDYDMDFIEALKTGLPECSGIAVGLDRLIMLFADVATIDETLFFPASEEFTQSR